MRRTCDEPLSPSHVQLDVPLLLCVRYLGPSPSRRKRKEITCEYKCIPDGSGRMNTTQFNTMANYNSTLQGEKARNKQGPSLSNKSKLATKGKKPGKNVKERGHSFG